MTEKTVSLCPVSGQPLISRDEAREHGLKRYRDGTACKHGHYAERSVADKRCVECRKESDKKKYQANPEKYRAITREKYKKFTPEDHEKRRRQCRESYERNKEKRLAEMAEYQKNNKEKLINFNKAYQENNKEKLKIYRKNRRKNHKEKIRKQKAEYYQRHKPRLLAKNKKYRQENADKCRLYGKNRYARKMKAEGTFTKEDIKKIYERQKGKCHWCGVKLSFQEKTIDHIKPLVKGGSNWPSNLCIACKPCNSSKKDKDPEDFAREKGLLI